LAVGKGLFCQSRAVLHTLAVEVVAPNRRIWNEPYIISEGCGKPSKLGLKLGAATLIQVHQKGSRFWVENANLIATLWATHLAICEHLRASVIL
jgi:hypothetical protein